MLDTEEQAIANDNGYDIFALAKVDCSRFLMREFQSEELSLKEKVVSLVERNKPVTSARIGVIPVMGLLTKMGCEFGSSTMAIGDIVEQAANSGQFDGLMLLVDSPGGHVAGIYDSVSKIATAAKKIPIHTHVQDLGASGAVALTTPSARITINSSGLMGSMGTYTAIDDSSGFFEQMGIKRHVIKAGEHKAAGMPGVPVTKEQIAERQKVIDALNEHFVSAFAAGRKTTLSKARELADGRIHVGQAAVDAGFADAVSTFDQAIAELVKVVSKSNSSRSKSMSEHVTPVAATLTELKAAFPNAGSDFVLGQLEAAATMDQARHAFEIHQRDAEIAKLKAENEAALNAKSEAEKRANEKPKSHGFDPVPIGGKAGAAASSGEGGAIAQWNAAIEEKIGPRVTRQQAAVMVAKENPALQQAYIEEYRQKAAQRA